MTESSSNAQLVSTRAPLISSESSMLACAEVEGTLTNADSLIDWQRQKVQWVVVSVAERRSETVPPALEEQEMNSQLAVNDSPETVSVRVLCAAPVVGDSLPHVRNVQ